MAEKKLFLFPGAHKTGTTLLQSSLEVNRSLLEAEGISVARRHQFYFSGMHHALKKPNGLTKFDKKDLEECILSIFNGPPKDKIVISIENIAGEISTRPYGSFETVIGNLKKLFPDHDMSICFYVRRQDTFIESAFVQQYQVGLRPDPDTFIKRFLDSPLDWMRPVRAMSQASSPDKVRILPYESIKEGTDLFISSFYRVFSEQDPKMFVSNMDENIFTNRSISTRGLKILDKAYGLIRSRKMRRKTARVIQDRFGTDKYPRFKFSDEVQGRLADLHCRMNERLVRHANFSKDMAAYYLFSDRAANPADETESRVAGTAGS